MSEQKEQSNAFPAFWSFKAELIDSSTLVGIDIYGDLNRLGAGKLRVIQLFFGGELRGSIEYTPLQRLIFIRRVEAVYVSGVLTPASFIYLVGWQSTINGANVKCILELHPNGGCILKNTDGRS